MTALESWPLPEPLEVPPDHTVEVNYWALRALQMRAGAFDKILEELRGIANQALSDNGTVDAGWLRDSFVEHWEDEC